VFLANPNNPTGYLAKKTDVLAFRKALRQDILLVIDSAYAEYADDPDYSDGKDMVQAFDNVVMLRTFSKAYGLSSLRVGWSYSSTYIADILNRIRGVFNLNVPGQVCAEAALADQAFIEMSVKNNTSQRHLMSEKLQEFGYTVYPSGGNFILFSLGSSEKAKQTLEHLKDNGILLRGMTAYELPDCLRMTIGTPEDMQAVLKALPR
jgi:histidinol-phosphate aminotransferase